MRLHSIYLQGYRVLKNFSLHFEHSSELSESLPETGQYALDLIVGVNGTGKSSLLRAIAEIFRRIDSIDAGVDFPFGFEITYQATSTSPYICITNLDDTPERQRLPEGSWLIGRGEHPGDLSFQLRTSSELATALPRNELPPLIVAFTTGSEKEWELYREPINQDQSESITLPLPSDQDTPEQLAQWFLKETPGEPIEEDQEQIRSLGLPLHTNRFLFIKEQHFPLIILCGLLVGMADANLAGQKNRLQKVLDACNIKTLHGFSLKLRMNKDVIEGLGRDYDFIRKLVDLTQHSTIQAGSDYLLVFDLADMDLPALLAEGGLELFRSLARLSEPQDSAPPILREVNLFLERSHDTQNNQNQQIPPLHLLDWLSDGERSFLGRLCLLSLLGSSKSGALILIDEPEVHFNDYWKRHLVSMIDSALYQQDSHVLMTTHSSITLSDVTSRDIWILRRDGAYTNQAVKPGVRTLGADPSDIMVYIFEAENAVGAQGEAYIERKLMEIAHITGETPESVAEKKRTALKALLQEVGPGDWSFLIRRDLNAL
jgi:predicted ATPase